MVRSKTVITICIVAVISSIALADLPTHFDWRDVGGKNWMTGVRDQGSCPSCWAFAAVGTVEAQFNIFFDWPDYDIELSEEELVSDCFYYNCGTGGWPYEALEYIRNSGITDESCFPYVDETCPGGCGCAHGCSNAECSDRCEEWGIRLWKIDGVDDVGSTVEEIKNYIYNVGPLAVSIDWYHGEFDQETGIRKCNQCCSYDHSVVLLGWDDPEGYWICKNSDGNDWGPESNGYFKVGFGECGVQDFAFGVTLANPDIVKFFIENSLGETVAWFGDLGTIVLKGTFTKEVYQLNEDPETDEFRVQDSSGADVAIIDTTNGNMFIKGTLHEKLGESIPAPSEESCDFIIKNSNDEVVSYIDDSGNLYLKGKLYQNPNP
jgi:hypothetical protein